MSIYDDIVKAIGSGFTQFSFMDAIDILIITILLYKIITWTRQTRAYNVLKGFGIVILCYFLSEILSLNVLNWVLASAVQWGVIFIAILFQPELRRVFEHLGRGNILLKSLPGGVQKDASETIRELHRCILSMAKRRVGALIVIEKKVALGDIIATGTRVDGIVSGALIENIFEPNTPLHDGALIIRDDTIVAAACILPLTDDADIGRELGTRHRASLGVSAVSDSFTFVVSEETGIISQAHEGKLVRYLDSKALLDTLENIYSMDKKGTPLLWWRPKNADES